ncbi:MAG: hypothetical protein WCI71_20050 [Bacteroidota bacterium]
MKARFRTLSLFAALSAVMFAGCQKDGAQGPPGPPGPAGQNATVYYSEWFSPNEWSGSSGDWYFAANAPDLTEAIVENGVVLAYAWLAGDVYGGSSVRPLPAYAIGANWSFLIHQYGSIEFTSDMFAPPATTTNKFRFVAIPGTIHASKSATSGFRSGQELRSMSYKEICRMYNIPE